MWLTFIWLRHYPTYAILAALFGTNPQMVGRTVYTMVDILWFHFHDMIRWLTKPEWRDGLRLIVLWVQ